MIYRHAAPYREVSPFDEEFTEDYKRHAYNYHDTLIEMGGRPTRPVLEKPAGNAVYEKDEIRIMDNHGGFQGTIAIDENLTHHHWTEECDRFYKELERWKEFRDHQRDTEDQPLLKTAIDPENTDQRLVKVLVRLNDWREFQHYQQVKVGRAAMLTWKVTRALEKIARKEAVSDEATSSPKTQYTIDTCLDQLFIRQQGLETSEMQLTWIESQIAEILSEACASLQATFPLQRQLEMNLEQQANAYHQKLEALEARPDASVRSPHQSAGFAQRLCHWGSEICRLMKELWEWKIFLRWRKTKPFTSQTGTHEEQESSGRSSDLQIWVDYVAYRRYQLDRTQSWVASWQRLLKSNEDDMETASKGLALLVLQDSTATVRANVKKFQQDIHTAEFRLRLAEQQLAELSSHESSSAPAQVTQQNTGHPRLPPSSLESKSPESIPGDLKLTDLGSSPTKVHRLSGSTNSPISGIPGSVQPSKGKINEKQPVTVADVLVPNQVILDDAIQLTDTAENSYPHEAFGEHEGARSVDIWRSSVEGTLMSDIEDPVTTSPPPAYNLSIKGRGSRAKRKSRLPVDQVPTSRKTRSATELDHDTSDRVLKDTDKKSVRKKKGFSERQTMALLSTASTNGSSTGSSPSLRRSQRLKEKAAASKRKVCI